MKTFQICKEISITNCASHSSYDVCSTCKEGYYITDQKKCEKYPTNLQPNCIQYKDLERCSECDNGYYIVEHKCVSIKKINNCVQYNSQTGDCTQCSDNYYYESHSCIQRINSKNQKILNCQVKQQTADLCEECFPGYLLSIDYLKCLPKIDNCDQYNDFSSYEDNIICNQCSSGYYFQDHKCHKGDIKNCQIYENQNICKKCLNGYYLQNENQCISHLNIKNCISYHQQKPNTCIKCKNGFLPFILKTDCINLDFIINCEEYYIENKQSACKKCQPGYYFSSSGRCIDLVDQNCAIIGTDGKCSHCFGGYVLDGSETHLCVIPPKHITENCLKHTAEDINSLTIFEVTCEICDDFHQPFNYITRHVCVSNETHLQLYGVTRTEFCLKYNLNKECHLCEPGYFMKMINNKYECIIKCDEEDALLQLNIAFIEGRFRHTQTNVCIQDEKCLIRAPKTYNFFTQEQSFPQPGDTYLNSICIICKSGYLNVIDSIYQEISTNVSKSVWTVSDNPLARNTSVECIQPSKVNDLLNINKIDHCEYYIRGKVSSELYCIKCYLGYSGKVVINEKSISYIEQCQEMTDCDETVEYYGLPPVLNNLVSCNKCIDQTKIPLLAVDTYNEPGNYKIKGPYPYAYSLYLKNYVKGFENPIIKCMIPHFTEVYLGIDFNFQFPTNCALTILNLASFGFNFSDSANVNANPNDQLNLAIYCAACKPGYKALYLEGYDDIVLRCTKIPNCLNDSENYIQHYYNRCSKCQDKYVFYIDLSATNFFLIDYITCIYNIIPNCFAAFEESTCYICQKGYQLNLDSYCELIISPFCTSSENSVIYMKKVVGNMLNYFVFKAGGGVGCIYCSSGYSSVQIPNNVYQCINSSYIKQNYSLFNNTSHYIKECINYGIVKDQLICQKCNENFIITYDHKKCVKMIENCLFAYSEQQQYCYKCQPGYGLVNFKCVSGNIDYCEEYYDNINTTQIFCKKCTSNYYLNSLKTICIQSTVDFCDITKFDSKIRCEKCQKGYTLFHSTIDFCFKIDESLNCQESEILDESLTCISCSHPNQILQNKITLINPNIINSVCLAYSEVKNCKTYDIQEEWKQTTPMCIECINTYYLLNNLCVKRSLVVRNCVQYYIDQDRCQQCSQGYFINSIGSTCNSNPSGITNCLTYLNKNQCSICNTGYYLENNECLSVETYTISHCKYYLKKSQCSQCENGYFLKNNSCLLTTVANCKVFKDKNICSECNNGYILVLNKGETICDKINISNCSIYASDGTPTCAKCNQGYYLNSDKQCYYAANSIPNCLIYKSSSTCQQCDSRYVLSSDYLYCMSKSELNFYIDPNCQSLKYLKVPQCSACQNGYYFSEGKCVKCQITQESGCHQCDYQYPNICLICKSGYYMTEEAICVNIELDDNLTSAITSGDSLRNVLVVFLVALIN